jgi:hypothetical protein
MKEALVLLGRLPRATERRRSSDCAGEIERSRKAQDAQDCSTAGRRCAPPE